MSYQYDLFLSHNGIDKAWTEGLAIAIEADRNGPPLKVYFDKWDLPAGGNIPLELERALESSRYVGLVLTPEALSSSWVSLERSSAIASDPNSANLTLIPLLRRDCKIPKMLAQIKYIDFRREQDFYNSLSELIAVLRGKPHDRGKGVSQEDIHFREDAALLKQHRKAFARPAFRTPCIWELFLRELSQAIDDTQAAINTGSLYSRDRNLLSTFPEQNEYRTREFKDGFREISTLLTGLKREVTLFEHFFQQANPNYSHHSNFYAMLMDLRWSAPMHIPQAVNYMDRIDSIRNSILQILNSLLLKCNEEPFDLIELSSEVIKKGTIGGADSIKSHLT